MVFTQVVVKRNRKWPANLIAFLRLQSDRLRSEIFCPQNESIQCVASGVFLLFPDVPRQCVELKAHCPPELHGFHSHSNDSPILPTIISSSIFFFLSPDLISETLSRTIKIIFNIITKSAAARFSRIYLNTLVSLRTAHERPYHVCIGIKYKRVLYVHTSQNPSGTMNWKRDRPRWTENVDRGFFVLLYATPPPMRVQYIVWPFVHSASSRATISPLSPTNSSRHYLSPRYRMIFLSVTTYQP